MSNIASTNAYSERILLDGEPVVVKVIDVEFLDGRLKRYRTMPDDTVQVEEFYQGQSLQS